MYGMDLFIAIAFAIFYFRVGMTEYGNGVIPTMLSILVTVLATSLLTAGIWLLIVLQLTLFIGMIFYNMYFRKTRFF